ncbi:MAG: hypothetical protein HQ483_09640 [Rhodospirillales bacterium]|nr:hypothetical protein [Rhodospirillales bacterium]
MNKLNSIADELHKIIGYWQEPNRAIENRRSDALPERLTRRFVDRRTRQLMRRMKEQQELLAAPCNWHGPHSALKGNRRSAERGWIRTTC